MKELLLAATLLTAAGSVFAADMPVKAPRYNDAPAVAPSWMGFYAGASLGARLADNDWRSSDLAPSVAAIAQLGAVSGSMDSTAARIGAYAGYNWQLTPFVIVGFETDFGWANNRSTANPAPGTNSSQGGVPFTTSLPIATVSERWDGSVRGRLGMLITPNALLYGTPGLAWQSVQLSASCTALIVGNAYCTLNHNESDSRTMSGWTVGGGLEHRVVGQLACTG